MLRAKAHASSASSPSTMLQSDRALLTAIRNRDAAALGRLYDRYSHVVFALACASAPARAEAILEGVFARVWAKEQSSKLPLPLLPALLELIAQHTEQVPPPLADPHKAPGAQLSLPALAPFVGLDSFTLYVFLLAYLGRLKVHEIAVALEADQDDVKHALAAAVTRLRQTACASSEGALVPVR